MTLGEGTQHLQKLKLVGIVVIAAVAMIVTPQTMMADTINLGGLNAVVSFANVASNNCSAGATSCQEVSFSGVQVANPITPSDPAILGATVTISNDFVGWNGSQATFTPNPGTLSINYGTNTLNAGVSWENITATGSGGFAFNFGLNGITVTPGTTDPIMNALAGDGGYGLVTFQFTTGQSSINSLLTQTATDPNPLQTSLSGTITTPEPSSLMMFGAGTFGLLGMLRRRKLL